MIRRQRTGRGTIHARLGRVLHRARCRARSIHIRHAGGAALEEALRLLQARGVRLVFSSQLVTPEMRVRVEPMVSFPRAQLDELLAPHGLAAERGPGGVIQIVRRRPTPAARARAATAAPPGSRPPRRRPRRATWLSRAGDGHSAPPGPGWCAGGRDDSTAWASAVAHSAATWATTRCGRCRRSQALRPPTISEASTRFEAAPSVTPASSSMAWPRRGCNMPRWDAGTPGRSPCFAAT